MSLYVCPAYLHAELTSVLIARGVSAGLAVRQNVPVSWNALRERKAAIDVGWYDGLTERLVVAWVIARCDCVLSTSVAVFAGCTAALKIEVSQGRRRDYHTLSPETFLPLPAREVIRPRTGGGLERIVDAAKETAALLGGPTRQVTIRHPVLQ